jgi:RimJ/RimL family protein N-acetyltransferase
MSIRSFSPQLQLETLFVLDAAGRIRSTREPNPAHGPAFVLVRDRRSFAWAVHADLPSNIDRELSALARSETPTNVISDPPRHADRYTALLGGQIDAGPVFTFPPPRSPSGDTSVVESIAELTRHFRGWTADEIPERSPIVAMMHDGHAISVCFSARRSSDAAEAGVETAVEFRGRGYGAHVTAAWARLIRESGRLPLYSTSWSNMASLAVARKLALTPAASDWSISLA